ncbi:hypothetical protein [Leptospira barantonii]|uniref:SRPBCC family protein n=1 Tax=Leptospira barantonii TaxID=2023184 RepID=A0ABX4NT85_9LEPT|nr:hypothetical protein [Leptospira barantonii]PJZ58827.1 hypothetical protein CH367_01930 [Leptospira barantonii]
METEKRKFKVAQIITACVIAGALIAFLIFAPFWALNGNYGYVLFIAYPFSLGALGGFLISIFTKDAVRTFGYVFKVTFILTILSILVFFVYAKEGIICILMALPIVYVLLFIGTLFGSVIYQRVFSKYLLILTVLFFNVSAYLYDYGDKESDLHEVRTWVEVDASKKEIWEKLVSPFEFGEANNFFLRNGVSYPISMKIVEYNKKRILYCDYTNGSASADIDSFVNQEKISFSFPEPQVTMKETSLYGEVEPKHIRGKIWAKSGEFQLMEISGNRTKLIAVTKYVNNLGPKFYWELWENYLVDEMHLHVLNKVKEKLESR